MDAVDLAVRLIQCVPQDSRDAFGKDLRAFESAVRQQALEEAARILEAEADEQEAAANRYIPGTRLYHEHYDRAYDRRDAAAAIRAKGGR